MLVKLDDSSPIKLQITRESFHHIRNLRIVFVTASYIVHFSALSSAIVASPFFPLEFALEFFLKPN